MFIYTVYTVSNEHVKKQKRILTNKRKNIFVDVFLYYIKLASTMCSFMYLEERYTGAVFYNDPSLSPQVCQYVCLLFLSYSLSSFSPGLSRSDFVLYCLSGEVSCCFF